LKKKAEQALKKVKGKKKVNNKTSLIGNMDEELKIDIAPPQFDN
jgi:hypothetical protein